MSHAGERTGGDRRRQRTGKDEAWRMASNKIHERSRCSNIAADKPESLCERALYDGQSIGQPVSFGYSATPRAVKPDGVNLVQIGHGAIPLRDVAQLGQRG